MPARECDRIMVPAITMPTNPTSVHLPPVNSEPKLINPWEETEM